MSSFCLICHVNHRIQYTDQQESYCDACIRVGREYDWDEFFLHTKKCGRVPVQELLSRKILPVTCNTTNRTRFVGMLWKSIIHPDRFTGELFDYDRLVYIPLRSPIMITNDILYSGGIILQY